jgi:hypothetical protein
MVILFSLGVEIVNASPPSSDRDGQDLAEAKARLSLHHQERLRPGVMIMSAARHARIGREERELPGVRRLEHLDEDAARVGVARQGIAEGVRRECADVGGVEGADQAGSDRLGDQARLCGGP